MAATPRALIRDDRGGVPLVLAALVDGMLPM
jgi:hypothetical protein